MPSSMDITDFANTTCRTLDHRSFMIYLANSHQLKIHVYSPCQLIQYFQIKERDRCGHDRIVVGFTITYVISAYHHQKL
jgi:hypothetical protein